uniref:hypothetical protein n=1 Tax=Christensenella hongkongensis TaxID=270498 RepID=UPI002673DBC9
TRLSDGALEKIKSYAKDYDDDSESRRYLNTLSTLVQSNFLLERIVDFFYIDTEADGITTPEEQDTPESSKDGIYAKTYANVLQQPSIFIGHETLTPPDIEDAYLLGIVRALYASKKIVNENIPATLRNYRTKQKDAE